MKCLAIVTARGGSKRIPGKNIRDFLGKPILSYSIKCAIESGAFDEVMVSTDSEEIAEIAKNILHGFPGGKWLLFLRLIAFLIKNILLYEDLDH